MVEVNQVYEVNTGQQQQVPNILRMLQQEFEPVLLELAD
jgi:hypothetical protein